MTSGKNRHLHPDLVYESVYHFTLARFIVAFWPISITELRPSEAMIWGFLKRDVVVVSRCDKRCRSVSSSSGGPPLLGRSLCVQWGPRNRRSKLAIFGVFSHFDVECQVPDVDKMHSSLFFLHLLVLPGPSIGSKIA